MAAGQILHNGRIHTLDTASSVVDAIAFGRDGKILALGRLHDMQSLIDETTEVFDLQGCFVMPGLIDFHLHALPGMIVKLYSTRLKPTDNFAAVLERIRLAALEPGEREWIVGSAFGPSALADMQQLGAQALHMLDAVSNGRPVVLEHVSGHGIFANSAALVRAGITAHTPNPPDGEIVKVAGQVTGLLHETAAWLVQDKIPALTPQQMIDVAGKAVALFNSVGMTGFCDASSTIDMLNTFRALDDQGRLTCWAGFTLALSSTCPGYDPAAAEHLLAEHRNICGEHMIAGAAKIFLDGVPSLRTAAMIDPYPSDDPDVLPDHRGAMALSPEELEEEIARFDRLGLSVKVHAIGDRAVLTVIDAVEAVRRTNGPNGPQHHIAHGQFIRPDDIARLSQLNILADLNPPLWFPSSASLTHKGIVGDQRYASTWPVRSLLDTGTDVAVGSDWLTIFADINPWLALSGLLTRRDPTGKFPGVHAPEQAISLHQALPLFTRNPALAMRLGEKTGQLAVGLSADLIVLDRDLTTISPEHIAGTKVLATFFQGRLVHPADKHVKGIFRLTTHV
ncbi:amidohydrolase [Phyllobacterium myrsinacearum]|uniref:Amidohydrolase n=1 Tax=Phyllobacterium myrsinacearum TaxID=28101 RepID=A0A2S9JAX6_9HYPH|nr:amidohydrolase [Phyllobacterium myrsinacearum]PWV86560.1 hypothetical protein DEV92_11642 [Phyllobacterium myrsinacearum]RZU96912.1 hypothetical protein EV654_5098 [Phyllobacterium myrsinacearum]